MTSTIANRPSIPPGFRLKADGSYVPEALVSDIDKLRDQTIETLIDQAKVISTLLADFKVRAFRDIEAFVETSVEQYGVKSRSVKKPDADLVQRTLHDPAADPGSPRVRRALAWGQDPDRRVHHVLV